jgi:uncharacterized membrane protein
VRAAELVEAAFGHIRHAAGRSPSVTRKLRQSLALLVGRVQDSALRFELERELLALQPGE